MKLYMHPASTTSRPILLFIADHNLDVEQRLVDIKSGEQHQPWFGLINPNRMVPVLEDGSFRLTEGSAILKYLADKIGSPTYPTELQSRARVNEIMDWFNTNLCRTFVYGFCYPQLMDAYRLSDQAAQKEAVAANKRSVERFLRVLNDSLLGGEKQWLCNNTMTIADYLGSGMISLGEVIGCSFAAYPHVERWYSQMKSRPHWDKANAGLSAWINAARGPSYETV
jgi:glutathione S-transferase